MHPAPAPATQSATSVPNWIDVDAARERLAKEIDAFVAAAARHGSNKQAAFRVSPGVGKTRAALQAVAKHAADLLARGHVMVYMPTLALADEAARDFREIAPGVPTRVIRGRSAISPSGQRMCQSYDTVHEVQHLVPSVTRSYCRRTTVTGEIRSAPCAAGCPYLDQIDATGAHVTFLAHTYLVSGAPVDPDVPVALRVVDEKIWSKLISQRKISDTDFLAPMKGTASASNKAGDTAARAIWTALCAGAPIRAALDDVGISLDQLRELAEVEREENPAMDIWPGISDCKLSTTMRTFSHASYLTARFRADLFEMLAETNGEPGNRLSLRQGETTELNMNKLEVLPGDAPLLLLDADADPEIVRTIAPRAEFHAVDVKPQAEIIQISDLTMSDRYLTGPAGSEIRANIRAIVAAEVALRKQAKVLVVATSKVIKAFSSDPSDKAAPFDGADCRCFGPRMQGLNRFSEHDTVVIIGRLQPPLPAVEDQARAVYFDSDPIVPHTDGALPKVEGHYLMRKGTLAPGNARNHPDPRVQTLLAQTRECGTLQAIARLRLASPDRKKRVIVLCNLPLPNFPVSKLMTFEELVAAATGEPDAKGRKILEPALRDARARRLKSLGLSANDLHSDLPATFPSVSRAKNFRRNRSPDDVGALVLRIADAQGWHAEIRMEIPAGGGRAAPRVYF